MMAEETSSVNAWVRADLETFNVETLALIPQGQQEEYGRIIKELAHAKAIANLALERVYLFETERHDFFEGIEGSNERT